MESLNSISRRKFINHLMVSGAVISGSSLLGNQLFAVGSKSQVRRFHISMQAEA